MEDGPGQGGRGAHAKSSDRRLTCSGAGVERLRASLGDRFGDDLHGLDPVDVQKADEDPCSSVRDGRLPVTAASTSVQQR